MHFEYQQQKYLKTENEHLLNSLLDHFLANIHLESHFSIQHFSSAANRQFLVAQKMDKETNNFLVENQLLVGPRLFMIASRDKKLWFWRIFKPKIETIGGCLRKCWMEKCDSW
jgi:hypothetical protein